MNMFSFVIISPDSELSDGTLETRNRREIPKVYVEPPHLCTQKIIDGKPVIDRCHVYTNDLDSVKVQASLRGATNQENETHSAEWCNYPLGKYGTVFKMKNLTNLVCVSQMVSHAIFPAIKSST